MKFIKLTIALTLVALSGLSAAHSGGTDNNGCHRDRKTGLYHWH
jgi:hypothetical protein